MTTTVLAAGAGNGTVLAIAGTSITVGALAVGWLIWQAWENGIGKTLVTAFCGMLVPIVGTIGLALAGVLTTLSSAVSSIGGGG